MDLIKWEPFPEFVSLRQAMDRMLEDSFVLPARLDGVLGRSPALPVDVYQTPNEMVIKADLPGAKPEEVEVSITGDTLTIKGESKDETEVKRDGYFLKERRFGSFSRSLTLPPGLNSDSVEAKFENGVLTLTVPKAEEVKPKQIKIKAAA